MLTRKNLLAIGILAVVYFVVGKLGLRLAFVHPSASAVWPPSGIALAAVLMFGSRVWPGIMLGALLVNLTTAGSLATSLGIAVGNTLEAVVGAHLVNEFAGGRQAFQRAQDKFKFAILAGMVSTTVAATFGVTSLALGGFAPWNHYGSIWLTWWLGDAVGIVVVTPLVILWATRNHERWTVMRGVEAAALAVCLLLVSHLVFAGNILAPKRYPLEYLCLPFLVWAAYRFSPREAATAILLLATVASVGTLRGSGPFARATPNESLLLLQSFLGIVTVMTLAFAAALAERRRAEERAYYLAITDSLTGLANYRRLIEEMEAEIRRSARSGKPFALLLLDLDELKKINDAQGHLVGSRALCRVADVLRAQCRDIDTPGRYGGDEFAVILPESGSTAASQVASRIYERLARDGEQPTLSVSIGVAEYPQDGETVEALLRAADRVLYEMKKRLHREVT
ncbi:MAG TPA: MASE1 domain-containing protein [Terriglobales bacterium]|nr:MASE1 domain-containing protein [Terriglobales bacterium]